MDIFHWLPSLATLFFLELVLGIDNLVFVALAASTLPLKEQPKARNFGLVLALGTRLLLLFSASWIAHLTDPFFTVFDWPVSGRSLLLGLGGLFLILKGTLETRELLSIKEAQEHALKAKNKFISVIIQIALLDIVFSLDSVITAVGMVSEFWIMATAIVLSVIFMLYANHPLSRFIAANPTLKMLATSFIIMIGVVLFADGLGFHIPRAYLYFAIGFSLTVEVLNMQLRRRQVISKK